jgi:hypothetical protein
VEQEQETQQPHWLFDRLIMWNGVLFLANAAFGLTLLLAVLIDKSRVHNPVLAEYDVQDTRLFNIYRSLLMLVGIFLAVLGFGALAVRTVMHKFRQDNR